MKMTFFYPFSSSQKQHAPSKEAGKLLSESQRSLKSVVGGEKLE